MRTFKAILSILVTTGLTLLLNTRIPTEEGTIPPLGKFLSPFHGFWQNAQNERLSIPETLEIEGLKESVKVYFDELLIPHIYAKNDHDLFMTQGYITAFHRLWQMEFQLLSTAGRISEIIGKDAIDYDRSKRRLGITRAARLSEKILKKEDPDDYALFDAYSKGVNAYINSLSYKDYPIEYKLLDYAPEEWTNFKSFLLIREMADQLSRDERDLEHTNARNLWGEEIFERLYPERYQDVDPVIPAGTAWDFEPVLVEPPVSSDVVSGFTKGEVSRPSAHFGSNNFVLNGNKTYNGSVLLANEPDLALNLPSIWYVVHLNSPTYNVMGSSVPGSPGVTLGFNDHVAWGFTNAKRDLVDWYQIEFRDENRDEYKYDNKWLKTKKVIEEIKIRGSKTLYDTVIYTHYGPVFYDESFNGEEERVNMALRWTAQDASKEGKSIFLMNRAKDYDDYVEAFKYYSGPPQNMIYGDVDGNIALWINGKFPVKWKGQGKYVLDGTNSKNEWQAYMPREHLYKVKNPDQNFISSANQHPGDGTYPYYDYDYNFEHYRNRRINDRLKVMGDVKPEDMMKLQNDNFSYMAFESLPYMLRAMDSVVLNEEEQQVINLLSEWDFFTEPDQVEPSYYHSWFDKFYYLTWDEFDDQQLSLYRPHDEVTIQLMKEDSAFHFFDILSTSEKETAIQVIRESFKRAMTAIAAWKEENGDDLSWYKFKNTTVQHILKIDVFSKSQVNIGGNYGIVNAASKRAGPSWRFVVELNNTEGVKAWGIYPGGQTGNPGNPAYTELIERWATGKYERLTFSQDVSSDDRIIFTQTINPVK